MFCLLAEKINMLNVS